MNIYDQHMHSFLSSDTNEEYENYINAAIEKGASHLITTEHLDLSSVYLGRDDIYDIALQDELIEKYSKKYSLTFLKGVELGYKVSRLKEIEEIANSSNYDLVIMSIHENEEGDCTARSFIQNLSANQAYDKYLSLYINMLENTSAFDTVGHIDFLLRYIGRVEIEKHEKKLRQIFDLIVQKNKSLEFNTRFLYGYKDSTYLKYIFSLYYACNGRKITLGSDAHLAHNYMAAFDEAIEILKKIGFEYLSFYIKRKEIQIKI